jgi:glycosyltransferase involved in cell wall biosynthesis
VHIQYPTVAYKKNILFNLLPFLIKKKSSFIKIINTFHEPINELSLAGKIRMFPNILFSDGFVFVEKEAYQRLPFFLKNIAKNKKIVFIPVASNIPKIEINKNYKNKIIKKYHLTPKTKLIITFGFINKIKNYEILFNVYNQKKHSWLHIGDLDKNNLYQMEFLKKALKSNINIKFTGYVEKLEVAKLLACADVCVFPFIKGISTRHATFMAAVIQNSYVIATHKNKIGFKKKQNVFYIPPNNIEYLKKAFEFNPGKSRHKKNDFSTAWQKIAEQHLLFYKKII